MKSLINLKVVDATFGIGGPLFRMTPCLCAWTEQCSWKEIFRCSSSVIFTTALAHSAERNWI